MLTSALYGLVSGSTLFIGALIGMYLNIPKYALALIMAFGSGVLISALTFDLMEKAFQTGGFYSVSVGFIIGTILFVLGDYFIDKFGGHQRKQEHGRIYSVKKTVPPNSVWADSGSAIFLGALLDGIPESIAIGVGLTAGSTIGFSMMIAVMLSNLPEGISGSQAMKRIGKSQFYIMTVWGTTIATSVCAALLGYAVFGHTSKEIISVTISLAAGAVLAMIADTMIPEAFANGGRFTALATAFGFLIAFISSH